MSDEIKTDREYVLATIQKMDVVCENYDYSWPDVLIHWIRDAADNETNLSQSKYYKDVLLRDFFACDDFDTTLGIIVQAFQAGDVHQLRAENERLRAERDALKTAAREFLTTLGAALKTGKFHMNGSADMCHFVRQAMQKLDVLAFDREEKRPVGLERLHEEAKP